MAMKGYSTFPKSFSITVASPPDCLVSFWDVLMYDWEEEKLWIQNLTSVLWGEYDRLPRLLLLLGYIKSVTGSIKSFTSINKSAM